MLIDISHERARKRQKVSFANEVCFRDYEDDDTVNSFEPTKDFDFQKPAVRIAYSLMELASKTSTSIRDDAARNMFGRVLEKGDIDPTILESVTKKIAWGVSKLEDGTKVIVLPSTINLVREDHLQRMRLIGDQLKTLEPTAQ